MTGLGDLGGTVRRHAVVTAIGAVALCAAILILATNGDGEADVAGAESNVAIQEPGGAVADPVEPADLLTAIRETFPLPYLDPELEPAAEQAPELRGPRYAIARVKSGKEIEVHSAPGEAVLARLGDQTEFGSQRNMWIQRIEGDWLGVPVAELPNGRLGWIRDDRSRLDIYETRYYVVADVSRRRLTLHYGNKVLERFPVTVGAPGSPTPTGAYAITDGLAGEGVGPYYGCCILALTGHQPNLPPDWLGGDRIAIHGTPGATGIAASAGCLRADDMDMVSLFARLPLGAPVFIRG